MPHPCVVATANTLKQLRHAAFTIEVAQGVPVSPHVYFSWDEKDGNVSVALRSEPGRLLTADIRVRGAPRWLTLAIDLGPGHFSERQTLGLAIRGASSAGFELAPFIRSRQDGATQDTTLHDTAQLQPQPRTVVLLHDVMPHEPLSQTGDYHALILPLPRQDFTLDLHDLRFFAAQRSEAAPSQRRTLTSVAF